MRILINAVNVTSPGSFQVVYNFIKVLPNIDKINRYLIILPSGVGYENINFDNNTQVRYFQSRISKKIWYIFFYEFILKSLINQFSPDILFAFGNFLPIKTKTPSLVFFHNSFYIDFKAISYLSWWERIIKKLEIAAFDRTTRNADAFIVQSNYIKDRLSVIWGVPHEKIAVCANSLSLTFMSENNFLFERPSFLKEKFILFYPSRFYPYKNHEFIIRVANYLRTRNIEDVAFIVTINDSFKGGKKYLQLIKDQGLIEMVINVGEVPQNELIKWYKISDALFYPSLLETFGNPLLEAMAFGLPICVVNLPYAEAVCGEAAIYYTYNSVEDAAKKILLIKDDEKIRNDYSLRVLRKFKSMPTMEQTAKNYLSILKSLVNSRKN